MTNVSVERFEHTRYNYLVEQRKFAVFVQVVNTATH